MKITEFPNDTTMPEEELLHTLYQMTEDIEIPDSLQPDAIEAMLSDLPKKKTTTFRKKVFSIGSMAAVFLLAFTALLNYQRLVPSSNQKSAETIAVTGHALSQEMEEAFDASQEIPPTLMQNKLSTDALTIEGSLADNLRAADAAAECEMSACEAPETETETESEELLP